MASDESLLRLIDVGALGGINKIWHPHLNATWPVLFEPNAKAADQLRIITQNFPKSTVIECALSNIDGSLSLNITRNPACISALEPNKLLLRHYGIKIHFEIIDRMEIKCARYDTLYSAGEVPKPDIIKIDTQGFEYEVLLGFGSLLQNCYAVELESHIYPLYRSQKLLQDVVLLLESYGLILTRLIPKTSGFDGNIVEVDAYFNRRRDEVARLTKGEQEKCKLISEIWAQI